MPESAQGSAKEPAGDGRGRVSVLVVVAVLAILLLGTIGLVAYIIVRGSPTPPREGETIVRPTGTILMAVRDLARLETNELHMEKVIDLTDKQSRFFGLVEATDAVLLVAAGDVTVGIDLTKVEETDFQVDHASGMVRLTLPSPEILSVRLDEENTYVYRRTTGILAHRNEQLESKARLEAVRAIGDAARDDKVMEKARKQAETQLQQLLQRFGVSRTTIGWRPI